MGNVFEDAWEGGKKAVKKGVKNVGENISNATSDVKDWWREEVQDPLNLDGIERGVRDYVKINSSPLTDIREGRIGEGLVGILTTPYRQLQRIKQSGEMQNLDDGWNKSMGNMTDAEQAAYDKEQARIKETNNRAKNLEAANKDTTIDEVSRNEIMSMYQSGASSSKLAAVLRGAREGDKGVYAVRKLNQAQQDTMANNPGRRGTVRSLGYGSVI